jgi:hypothetical protein
VSALVPNSIIFSVGLSSTLHEEIGILFNVAVCITVNFDFIDYVGAGDLYFVQVHLA